MSYNPATDRSVGRRITGASDVVYVEPYLSATGVKKWKCHYCTAEWVAAHEGTLAGIHKHVEMEH